MGGAIGCCCRDGRGERSIHGRGNSGCTVWVGDDTDLGIEGKFGVVSDGRWSGLQSFNSIIGQ